jgi:hypothetical protein
MTDDEQIMIGAVRYALGRRTYIVSDCCRILRERWDNYGADARAIIHCDIAEAVARKETGDPMDHEEWAMMLAWIERRPKMADPRDARTDEEMAGRDPIFRNHNCASCDSGLRPCVRGHYRNCERLHARND